jgi:outer membrane protein insertion porin family
MMPYTPGIPVNVKSVQIVGNDRTRQDFFDKELSDALSALTIDQLHDKLDIAVKRMQSYEIYDSVHAHIEHSVTGNNTYSADIHLKIKELGITTLKLNSYVKTGLHAIGMVGVEASGALRNPYGFGEVSRLSATTSHSGSKEYLASLTVPFPAPLFQSVSINAKESHDNQTRFAGFSQTETSVSIDGNINPLDLKQLLGLKKEPRSKHHLNYTFSVRDEIPLPHATQSRASASSDMILLHARASSKSALKYSYTVDTRPNGVNSSRGHLLDVSVEVALPPGTAQFIKSEAKGEFHSEIGPKLFGQNGLALSLGGSFGIMQAKGVSQFSDRFYLGGPMSLRGFETYGIGPRGIRSIHSSCTGSPLGGTTKLNCIAMVHWPIPLKIMAESGCRNFIFLNCGSLGSGFGSKFPLGQPRLSIGAGGSFAFGPAKFECSYSFPIIRAEQDVVKQFQIGAGLTIL